MRLVGYIRVSRVGGREGASFISPEVMRDQIAAYARAHSHEIVEWRDDLDQPGSTLNRPGMQAALAAVQHGEADGIIAAKLDRITRSLTDLGRLLHQAAEDGWNLIAVDVGLDLQTANGKLVAHVLGAIAEWELDRRRSDWNLARERAVARGIHVASRTPTGYRRRNDGILEPIPEIAAVIRELFARRALGQGWRQLSRFLDEQRIVTPYGNSTWGEGSVQHLIRNRVYVGEARSGHHVRVGAHEAIVTEAEWQAAQIAGVKAMPTSPTPSLLSGLVRCASCRYIAKADNMRDRNGDKLAMYRCRGRHSAGECPKPVAILARVLDPIVETAVLNWLRDERPTADASVATDELDAAVREANAAESDLFDYVASGALAIVGARAFEHGLAARRQRLDDANRAVGALKNRVVQFGQLTAGDLVDAWPELDVLERREIIASALDCVVVLPQLSGRPSRDRVLLVPAGEAPDDLPRRGRRVPLAPWPNTPVHFGMTTLENRDERPLNSL